MSELLVKVPSFELLRAEQLEFDLFSMSGNRLHRSGAWLSPGERQLLAVQGCYRNMETLPTVDSFNHEGHIFRFEAGLTEAEQAELEAQEATVPLLSEELAHSFDSSIGYFWQRLNKGASPDIALCEVVRDRLISEVTDKIDQIQYLSQVRVRDEFTYSHILDVTALSIALAIKVGFSAQEVREIALAALLHDLGKLMIPHTIMFKPSRLTEKEFQVMQLHPGLGYKIITEQLKLPELIARPALEHQEMYSGGGYPQGLKGDQIHPYSHIVKIADVYDALTSKRPYKESIPSSKAIKIMLSDGAKSFHMGYLQHFVELSNYPEYAAELFAPYTMSGAAS